MAFPRRAAIIFADMDVVDVTLGPCRMEGGEGVFLFDIRVEGVVKNAKALLT